MAAAELCMEDLKNNNFHNSDVKYVLLTKHIHDPTAWLRADVNDF